MIEVRIPQYQLMEFKQAHQVADYLWEYDIDWTQPVAKYECPSTHDVIFRQHWKFSRILFRQFNWPYMPEWKRRKWILFTQYWMEDGYVFRGPKSYY